MSGRGQRGSAGTKSFGVNTLPGRKNAATSSNTAFTKIGRILEGDDEESVFVRRCSRRIDILNAAIHVDNGHQASYHTRLQMASYLPSATALVLQMLKASLILPCVLLTVFIMRRKFMVYALYCRMKGRTKGRGITLVELQAIVAHPSTLSRWELPEWCHLSTGRSIPPRPSREGIDHCVSAFVGASLEDGMTSFVASRLGLDSSPITFKIGFVGEVAGHAMEGGVPFPNAVGNVTMKNNRIAPFGSSFVSLGRFPTLQALLHGHLPWPFEDAIASAESTLSGSFNQFPLFSGT
ncbi:hypothetical protein EDD85DRAFT_975887 [Armillaria nabsnona]|nr:hypothetical protein EDD85DRAFT_975887 [Armillaria nabsnona]